MPEKVICYTASYITFSLQNTLSHYYPTVSYSNTNPILYKADSTEQS